MQTLFYLSTGTVLLQRRKTKNVIDFFTHHTGNWESFQHYVKASFMGVVVVLDKDDPLVPFDLLFDTVSYTELWKVGSHLLR